jgi:Ran GTPase-activating protein (RanGAP) involved in mRNA processing and transport
MSAEARQTVYALVKQNKEDPAAVAARGVAASAAVAVPATEAPLFGGGALGVDEPLAGAAAAAAAGAGGGDSSSSDGDEAQAEQERQRRLVSWRFCATSDCVGQAELSNGGLGFEKTIFDGINHAATMALSGGSYRLELGGGICFKLRQHACTAQCPHRRLENLFVFLLAADKDISAGCGLDGWGLNCSGRLWSAGSYSDCTPATAGELEVRVLTASGAAEFWQAGMQLGRVTGLPAEVKLVVTLNQKGHYVKLGGGGAAGADEAEAEAERLVRQQFVAELAGEQFSTAEAEAAVQAVGSNKAAARSHVAIARQRARELQEARARSALILGYHMLAGRGRTESSFGDAGATQLADMLRDNNPAHTLHLGNSGVGNKGATQLADALRGNETVHTLTLNDNSIGDAGAMQLADMLQGNATIVNVDLRCNPMSSDARVRRIHGLSDSNPACAEAEQAIYALVKQNNKDPVAAAARAAAARAAVAMKNSIEAEGALLLADALRDNEAYAKGLEGYAQDMREARERQEALKRYAAYTLRLDGNSIGDAGATQVADALRGKKTWHTLDLRSNSIGDAGATQLADALRGNETARTLALSSNPIGDAGAAQLVDMLQGNATLTCVAVFQTPMSAEAMQAVAALVKQNMEDPAAAAARVAAASAAVAVPAAEARLDGGGAACTDEPQAGAVAVAAACAAPPASAASAGGGGDSSSSDDDEAEAEVTEFVGAADVHLDGEDVGDAGATRQTDALRGNVAAHTRGAGAGGAAGSGAAAVKALK